MSGGETLALLLVTSVLGQKYWVFDPLRCAARLAARQRGLAGSKYPRLDLKTVTWCTKLSDDPGCYIWLLYCRDSSCSCRSIRTCLSLLLTFFKMICHDNREKSTTSTLHDTSTDTTYDTRIPLLVPPIIVPGSTWQERTETIRPRISFRVRQGVAVTCNRVVVGGFTLSVSGVVRSFE
jgi:hypothetical protein